MEVLRRLVQLTLTLLTNSYLLFPISKTIYQGPLKVVCSPGLNCYSCPASTTYCPIGSIQQLLLGIRFSIESGNYFFGSYVLGSLGLIGTVTGRFTCGWLCPFGFFQELLYKLPTKKKFEVYSFTRYIKYVVLILFVFIFPVILVNEWGMGKPWFCKYLCPAGTLEAGIPLLIIQPDLRATIGLLFYNKVFWLLIFIVWSAYTSRPFCKTTCPLGAIYGLFNKVSLIRLELDKNKCTQCNACKNVCPMGIQFNLDQNSAECINCLRCMNEACHFGAIYVSCAGVELRSNQKDYGKQLPKNI